MKINMLLQGEVFKFYLLCHDSTTCLFFFEKEMMKFNSLVMIPALLFLFRKGNDEIQQVLLGRGLQTQHVFVMILVSPAPRFFLAQLDLAGPSAATSTVAPMRGPAQQLFSFGPVTAPGFSTPCLNLNLPRPSICILPDHFWPVFWAPETSGT